MLFAFLSLALAATSAIAQTPKLATFNTPTTLSVGDASPLAVKWTVNDAATVAYYQFQFAVVDAQSGAVLAKSSPTPVGTGQSSIAYTLPPGTGSVRVTVSATGSTAPNGVVWKDMPDFVTWTFAVQGRAQGPAPAPTPGTPPATSPGATPGPAPGTPPSTAATPGSDAVSGGIAAPKNNTAMATGVVLPSLALALGGVLTFQLL